MSPPFPSATTDGTRMPCGYLCFLGVHVVLPHTRLVVLLVLPCVGSQVRPVPHQRICVARLCVLSTPCAFGHQPVVGLVQCFGVLHVGVPV